MYKRQVTLHVPFGVRFPRNRMCSRVNGMNRCPFLTLMGNRAVALGRAVFHVLIPTSFGVNLSNHFHFPLQKLPTVVTGELPDSPIHRARSVPFPADCVGSTSRPQEHVIQTPGIELCRANLHTNSTGAPQSHSSRQDLHFLTKPVAGESDVTRTNCRRYVNT